jgi:hypothetical protein
MMKVINSEGGPFIAIECQDLHRWSGIYGLNFFKDVAPVETDYDAICDLSLNNYEELIGVAGGRDGAVLFLDLPLPTLIVEAATDHIYIAQIETSEKGWSKSQLHASDFESPIEWKDALHITFKDGHVVLFDSSYS